MAKLYTKNTWDDEVLAGPERFDIKEDAGAAFKSNMQIVLATGITTAGSPVSAARLNNLELGLDAVDTRVDAIDTILSDEIDLFTTAGTSTAYTITTTGAAALVTGEKFRVKFNATAGATPTLNRDSKGAKSLKYYDAQGNKQSCGASTIFANMIFDIIYDGTDYLLLNISTDRETIYKITPTVTSNNLTLTLTHADGTTPSATRPLWVKIGNTWRSITGALAVTKNAATNWGNAGSAELATNEIDWFVYLGYNATDGVVLGFSRIPYASLYSDFSATTTNEKYAAISTITNAAAGDDYINIGRFAATLSAGAGYTWTVPTFTNSNLIQRPIFETRSLAWTAAITSQGGTPTTVTATCKYIISMTKLFVIYSITVTTVGTATGAIFLSVPFTPTQVVQLSGGEFNNGLLGWAIYATTPRISTLKYDSTTFWVNGYLVIGSGTVLLI